MKFAGNESIRKQLEMSAGSGWRPSLAKIGYNTRILKSGNSECNL